MLLRISYPDIELTFLCANLLVSVCIGLNKRLFLELKLKCTLV